MLGFVANSYQSPTSKVVIVQKEKKKQNKQALAAEE